MHAGNDDCETIVFPFHMTRLKHLSIRGSSGMDGSTGPRGKGHAGLSFYIRKLLYVLRMAITAIGKRYFIPCKSSQDRICCSLVGCRGILVPIPWSIIYFDVYAIM